MKIHRSGLRFRPLPGARRTVSAWFFALGLLGVVGLAADSAQAQLGLRGFSLVTGVDGGLMGSANAAGDFNGDGYDDLAVGMPGAEVGGDASAGMVALLYGGPGDWSRVSIFSDQDLGGSSETFARFGWALATGDFDGDGHDDLVVGIPGRTVSGENEAGEIAVVYGGPLGLDHGTAQHFNQMPLPGAPEENDRFGFSLAAGDLSADGIDDLAIGVHLEDIQGPLALRVNAGAVNVMYGALGIGLRQLGSQLIHENTPGVGLNANSNENFGFSLAIGQFAHNANLDLAVGVPGEAVFGPGQQGALIIFPGAPGGLDPVAGEEVVFSQRTDGVLGTIEDGDDFGYSLAKGNFDGDLWTDLAIGVPGESELGATESGAVQILYGGAVGLTVHGDQFLVEGTIDGDVDTFDRFGMALAAGDFDADGRDDLAIGAPFDDSLGVANAGEVTVLYGTSTGVTFAGHQIFDMIFFDTLEEQDQFGYALTTGSFFSLDLSQDLAVGIPRRGSPLGFEPGASLVIRSRTIFSSGFETGDVSEWTSSTP